MGETGSKLADLLHLKVLIDVDTESSTRNGLATVYIVFPGILKTVSHFGRIGYTENCLAFWSD